MLRRMTIGRLAELADVNVETVRYYQRRGLIHEPHKPPSGQRSYPESALSRIGFIRRAQRLGFTLAEVKELLRLADATNAKAVLKLAEKRYASLTLHANRLSTMRRQLGKLIDKSRRFKGRGAGPIIAALRTA